MCRDILSGGRYALATGLCGVVSLLIFLPVAQAGNITIDSFDFPNPQATFFFPGPTQWGAGNPAGIEQVVPGVIGGERDVFVEVVGTPEPISAAGTIGHELSADAGLLQFATFGFGGPGSYLIAQYDGKDSDPEPSSGLTNSELLGELDEFDLTDGGTNNAFKFAFNDMDAGNGTWLDLGITVTGPAGLVGQYQGKIPESSEPFVHMVAFDEFTGDDTFDNVTSITFVFNDVASPTPNVDFELSSIEASQIPEPSTLALLSALGVLLLAVRAWRR